MNELTNAAKGIEISVNNLALCISLSSGFAIGVLLFVGFMIYAAIKGGKS